MLIWMYSTFGLLIQILAVFSPEECVCFGFEYGYFGFENAETRCLCCSVGLGHRDFLGGRMLMLMGPAMTVENRFKSSLNHIQLVGFLQLSLQFIR